MVACETNSSFVVSFALVRNGDTDFISIEDPMFGASKANLVVPIPRGTSEVGGLGVIEGREFADSIYKVISFEARKTSSIGVMRSTLV